ncbi:MAG: response regulator [Pseudomonadota bacterium]
MRILLVEDDPILALLATTTLQAEGHEVCGPAFDAVEALSLAACHKADLAFVDINLAGRDEGIALARSLRERHGIASIFISGQVAVARANCEVALGLLRKPYEPQDLTRSASIAQDLLLGRPSSLPLPASLELFDNRLLSGRNG